MPAQIWLTVDFEIQAGDEQNTASEVYVVTGTDDYAEAYALVALTAPLATVGFIRTGINPSYKGGGVWAASVQYTVPKVDQTPIDPADPDSSPGSGDDPDSLDSDAPLGPEYSVSITAGTTHITQSLETRSKIKRDGVAGVVPDYGKAIGVSKDGVAGTDIYTPKVEWSLSKYVARLSLNYLRKIIATCATTNDRKFMDWAQGECLFLGAEINKFVPNKGWPITFKFGSGTNKVNVDIVGGGALVLPSVRAFDHVWVVYDEVPDGGWMVTKPRYGYVERVYEETNFRQNLGI